MRHSDANRGRPLVALGALLACAALAVPAIFAVACNTSGLSRQPRATFSKLACLDSNGDHRLNESDATDVASVPDFDGDRRHDAADAAFFAGVDIELDPAAQADVCRRGAEAGPEYEVAHGYFEPSKVSCDDGARPVLLVGVGGGVTDLTDKGDAAGVRSIIDGIQRAYDTRGTDTIAVIAGAAMQGAKQPNVAMEQWLTNAVHVYLDRYPCLRTVLVGYSHGGVTVDVMAAHLEEAYAARFIEVVELDRVEFAYSGDTTSRPTIAHVFSIFETRSGVLSGSAYTGAANAELWDATGELAPERGDKGGSLQPVIHTTIDNSASVKQRIVDDVMRRS